MINLLAIAASIVFFVTLRGGGGFSSPGFFPTIIVIVCVALRSPPSVAVTVKVYFPSGSLPTILPDSLIVNPDGRPLAV